MYYAVQVLYTIFVLIRYTLCSLQEIAFLGMPSAFCL